MHDYFKPNANIFTYTEQADGLIRWLRGRRYLLALLWDIQLKIPSYRGRPKTVIRGVLTRWTSHYLAYRRLLELHPALVALATDDRLFLSGTAETHAKTREMLPVLQNPLLWHGLAR